MPKEHCLECGHPVICTHLKREIIEMALTLYKGDMRQVIAKLNLPKGELAGWVFTLGISPSMQGPLYYRYWKGERSATTAPREQR